MKALHEWRHDCHTDFDMIAILLGLYHQQLALNPQAQKESLTRALSQKAGSLPIQAFMRDGSSGIRPLSIHTAGGCKRINQLPLLRPYTNAASSPCC